VRLQARAQGGQQHGYNRGRCKSAGTT
jgi:hypothetical protein